MTFWLFWLLFAPVLVYVWWRASRRGSDASADDGDVTTSVSRSTGSPDEAGPK